MLANGVPFVAIGKGKAGGVSLLVAGAGEGDVLARLSSIKLLIPEADARTWASSNPDALIVVNWRDEWREPGPQPLTQQRFRTRWIQVWRAGVWRALPAQRIPLQPADSQLRYQPR